MHHKFQLSTIIQTILAFPRIPSYSYKPLTGPQDAIRLILLQPAPFLTSPISCRMIESSWGSESTQTGHLNQKSYTALSYTWGDPLPKAKIEIDGRPFHITQNLERALRHLRASRIAVKLWADSLCINQEDVEERNFHVSQMRSIYSAAQSTAIFLGEATEGSDALLHAIQ
ncbi:HET-domain-containing protein, partial [Acephala macrosclerotiorum]